jgi:hypothetical protein
MTLSDWNLYVSRIRWHFSDWAKKYIIAVSASAEKKRYHEYILKTTGLYLDVLESWFLPCKVLATSAAGDSTLSLQKTITPSNYTRYVGRIISGNGIPEETYVVSISASEIILSNSATSPNSNSIYTIGTNSVTFENILGLVASLNIIYKTRYVVDGYWTEFDLGLAPVQSQLDVLLYGGSAAVLNGTNIYSSLNTSLGFVGSDIDVLYNFAVQYAYFAYPSTIKDLEYVYDPDGDDVLSAFVQSLVDVTLPGGGTQQYKVYRSGWLTTILNETYQFEF